MNIALWLLQGFLACVFLFAAGLKLFAFSLMAGKSPGTENLHGLFIFIALCEIIGASGLILPRLTRIKPVLTPWAAAGLATIALLAAGFHLGRGEYGELPGAVVLFLLCSVVVWGRGFGRPSI